MPDTSSSISASSESSESSSPDSSSLNAPSARDVARAMIDAGGDLHVAARELGCEEFDLAKRVVSEEVIALLARRAEAQRIGRAVLSDTARRHALLVLNTVATQPLDDPDLSASERIRRADLARKASVDILRHAESLSDENGGEGNTRPPTRARKKDKSESPSERRERLQNKANQKLNRVLEAEVGPEEWDRRQRMGVRLKKHGLNYVPQLPNSGWKIDFDHPFCIELAREEPDLIENLRRGEAKEDEKARRTRATPLFSDPRAAMRFHTARAAAEAKVDTAKVEAETRARANENKNENPRGNVNANASANTNACGTTNAPGNVNTPGTTNASDTHKAQDTPTSQHPARHEAAVKEAAVKEDNLHRIMAINQYNESANAPENSPANVQMVRAGPTGLPQH